MISSRLIIKLTLAVGLLSPLVGCENSLTPFSGRASYSVYGALGTHRSQQWVRVKRLRSPILGGPDTSLSAQATITELSSGRSWTLRDSIFPVGENASVHNYWANMELKPKTKYQLRVTGRAGTTKTTTRTPTNTVAAIDPSRSTPGPPTDTVHVLSDTLHCRTRFKVTFRDAKVPYEAAVGYQYNNKTLWHRYDHVLTPGDNETETMVFVPEIAIAETIDPVDDPETCQYYEPRCQKLDSGTIKVAYTYIGTDWFGNRPTGDEGFDPRKIGTVQNGLGFFGGYFRDTISVTINRGIINRRPCYCSIFGCQD